MDKLAERRLSRWTLQSAARELVSNESVAFCLRRVLGSEVHVCYSARVERAHYKKLFICASVWMCPICAAKISERRRVELTKVIEQNVDAVPVLVTFTLAHTRGDKLRDVLRGMLAAYRRLKAGRWWADFGKRYRLIGSIRSLEVTYGENAWHPHLHCLFFFERGASLKTLEHELKERWQFVLRKESRGASHEHGVTVKFADAAVADYVSKLGSENVKVNKWTLEHEITKSTVKVSKKHGKTPMQLLGEFANGDKKSGLLWREYALTFKGSHQLEWSRGLRARLGVGVVESDDAVAKREDETAVLLAKLTLAQWKIILANDARGEVLEVASTGDEVQLWEFLESLGVERTDSNFAEV